MLLYSNTSFWRVVLETKGSLVLAWQNLLVGMLLALMTCVVSYLRSISSTLAAQLSPNNSIGWHMMGGTIVFAFVFRTNLGWQRYWEALGHLQIMYGMWADAFMQCVAFVNVTIAQHGTASQEPFLRDKLASLQTHFSLLSAFAAHRLTRGDVHRMQRNSEVASWKNQVVLRADLRIASDCTEAMDLPGFVKISDRCQLHSNLENSWLSDYCVVDVPTEDEVDLLTDVSDRVHAVMYMIIHDLAEISQHLSIAAPIQSRIYQELSNGMLGFQNAVKMADVPFPFQFAQLFNYLIMALSLVIPLYASTFTESVILGPFITYVVFQSILIINQVAMQLETPFGTDINDISVKDFHNRFLENIIEINQVSKHKCREMSPSNTLRHESTLPSSPSEIYPAGHLAETFAESPRTVSKASRGVQLVETLPESPRALVETLPRQTSTNSFAESMKTSSKTPRASHAVETLPETSRTLVETLPRQTSSSHFPESQRASVNSHAEASINKRRLTLTRAIEALEAGDRNDNGKREVNKHLDNAIVEINTTGDVGTPLRAFCEDNGKPDFPNRGIPQNDGCHQYTSESFMI